MKHKLLTILLTLIAALCLTLGLAACGGDTDNSGNTGSGSDTEQGTTKPDDGDKDPDKEDKDPDDGKEEPVEHEHVYTVENVCGVCGKKWEYTEGLQYVLYEVSSDAALPNEQRDPSYCVMGAGERGEREESGDIVLPYGYNGKWVTMIDEDAFWDCSGITSVTIPSSISIIGKGAFMDCTSLTHVEIPDSVTQIVYDAFMGCTSLKSVKIGKNAVVMDYAFSGCTALTDIELSDSVPSIGNRVFEDTGYYNDPSNWDESGVLYIGNHLIEGAEVGEGTYTVRTGTKTVADQAFRDSSLTGVVLPEGLICIGNQAFDGCEGLASVSIPDSVHHIGSDVFRGTAVYQDQANWENGEVLYLGHHLIEAKQTLAGNYTIRPDTNSIAEWAFYECVLLTGVTIPEGVTEIGTALFYGCSELKEVTLPKSVTLIGDAAFSECVALADIRYDGSHERWCEIYNDTLPEHAVIHCTDGNYDAEGNIVQ